MSEDGAHAGRGGGEAGARRIETSLERMARTPGSSIAMCHAQGKTAVYLSSDKRFIVEHTPDGTVTRTPLKGCAQ